MAKELSDSLREERRLREFMKTLGEKKQSDKGVCERVSIKGHVNGILYLQSVMVDITQTKENRLMIKPHAFVLIIN
jgi:hypothetical protein